LMRGDGQFSQRWSHIVAEHNHNCTTKAFALCRYVNMKFDASVHYLYYLVQSYMYMAVTGHIT